MPAQLPIMGGRLAFSVWDEDTISDELVGSFLLNAKDIIEAGPGGKFEWKNVFGAPPDTSGDDAVAMNENP